MRKPVFFVVLSLAQSVLSQDTVTWSLIASEGTTITGDGLLNEFGSLFSLDATWDRIKIVGGDFEYIFDFDPNLAGDNTETSIPLYGFSTTDTELQALVDQAGGAVFCRAATSTFSPGDTSWAITSVNDNFRDCGCNSGYWTGTGVYYGGMTGDCDVCGCHGGGFAGFKASGEPKGGLNIGISIYGDRWFLIAGEGKSVPGDGLLNEFASLFSHESTWSQVKIVSGSDVYMFDYDASFAEDTTDLAIPLTNFATTDGDFEALASEAGGAVLCRAATSSAKPGDSSWALLPASDTQWGCGCNSGSWEGQGVYYGGFAAGCDACGCHGGGFAGFKLDGVPKGGLNIGVQIYGKL